MINFFGNKKTVVEFVNALLHHSSIAWPSIMITSQEKSEVYCVSIATDISSEGIVKELGEIYFQTL